MLQEVELSKDGILLRPYRLTDVNAVFEAARESIPEMYPWMTWCHPDYKIAESGAWIESCSELWKNGESYNFAIMDTVTHAFLGGCGLNAISSAHKFANLGYWVRTSRTKQGVATRATLSLADFSFENLG
jgi:RimJ/RimL family protein N-acetyltransferase